MRVVVRVVALFTVLVVVVLMLGIAEPWTRLRERFAGPAPSL